MSIIDSITDILHNVMMVGTMFLAAIAVILGIYFQIINSKRKEESEDVLQGDTFDIEVEEDSPIMQDDKSDFNGFEKILRVMFVILIIMVIVYSIIRVLPLFIELP